MDLQTLSAVCVYLWSPADALLLDGVYTTLVSNYLTSPLLLQFITFARVNLYDMILIKESSAQY